MFMMEKADLFFIQRRRPPEQILKIWNPTLIRMHLLTSTVI